MSEKEQETQEILEEEAAPAAGPEEALPEEEAPGQAAEGESAVAELLREEKKQLEDKFLRLAAEYENYRRRTAREKESIWADAKGEAAAAFLPVYDNLERALKQETADEAYKKGVEMTMAQLKTVLEKLGITEIEALGQPFDPKVHNAVMHVEDEGLGENVVAEVFQAGFQLGDKVIRCSMVKVAN
ncbi:MAG: nucleotide exchange factor GrpE [Lawsonibacter sp.]|nr:nucleotide exchange factor GrpE [Lawsonibacter sp.]